MHSSHRQGGGLESPLGSCSIVDENDKSGGEKPLSYKKSVFRKNKTNSSSAAASAAAMAAAAAASSGGGNMSIPSSIVDVDSPLTARGSPAGTLPRRHHLMKGQGGGGFLSLRLCQFGTDSGLLASLGEGGRGVPGQLDEE